MFTLNDSLSLLFTCTGINFLNQSYSYLSKYLGYLTLDNIIEATVTENKGAMLHQKVKPKYQFLVFHQKVP